MIGPVRLNKYKTEIDFTTLIILAEEKIEGRSKPPYFPPRRKQILHHYSFLLTHQWLTFGLKYSYSFFFFNSR